MKRINITCPVCGSKAYLRPASVVYGDKAPDPDAKYYVCGRYPACDCYVAAHRKTMLPMGRWRIRPCGKSGTMRMWPWTVSGRMAS